MVVLMGECEVMAVMVMVMAMMVMVMAMAMMVRIIDSDGDKSDSVGTVMAMDSSCDGDTAFDENKRPICQDCEWRWSFIHGLKNGTTQLSKNTSTVE